MKKSIVKSIIYAYVCGIKSTDYLIQERDAALAKCKIAEAALKYANQTISGRDQAIEHYKLLYEQSQAQAKSRHKRPIMRKTLNH